MIEIINNIRFFLPIIALLWGVFLILTLRKPQRFRNSIVLMAALFFTMFFIAGLFGDYMSHVLIICFILFFLSLLIVPFLLIDNGITMIHRESASFANLLSLILGALIAIGEIATFVNILCSESYEQMPTVFNLTAFISTSIIYFSMWILTFVLYIVSIQFMPHRMNFKYIIIHGCGLIGGKRVSKLLSDRIDKAIEIYEKCADKPIIIASGGKGTDEAVSEADAIKGYLLEHGIPEDKIIAEDRSTTTMENLQNCREIINRRNEKGRIALVSSNYHIYRCILYASKLGMKCTGIGAKVAFYYFPSATLREFAAVFTSYPHILWIILGYMLSVVIPFAIQIFVQ